MRRAPRSEQAPEAAVGLQQVHQVFVEERLNALAVGPAPQGSYIDDVVADQQIGAAAGGDAADADGGDAGTDDVGWPANGEAGGSPRLSVPQVREDQPSQAVVRDRFAEEPAALDGHGVRGADNLDAQAGIVAQLPEDANADLEALAVVARQRDQGAALAAKEFLQVAVDLALFQWRAGAIRKAELGEFTRIPARPAEVLLQKNPPEASNLARA